MSSYFIRLNGKMVGPLETTKIRQLMERGKCNGNTPVSSDRSRWFSLSDIADFRVVTPVVKVAKAEAATVARVQPLFTCTCPSCSYRFRESPGRRGMSVNCPACGTAFIAPGIETSSGGNVQPSLMSSPLDVAGRADHTIRNVILAGVAVVIAVLLAAGGVFWYLTRPSGGDFKSVVERYRQAVGVVVLVVSDREGTKRSIPVGTAFAISPSHFATNGHVALDIRQLSQKGEDVGLSVDSVEIRLSNTGGKAYPVTHVQIHKQYNDIANPGYNPDVAVLTVAGKVDTYFQRASRRQLESLTAGMRIASLGFPMEGLVNRNINVLEPVATFADGVIKSMTDFEEKDAGPSGNVSIKHSIPTTGGSSGSPIFLSDGRVIGIIWGGNVVLESSGRRPSAAMHNFGVRIDLLDGVGDPVALKDFLGNH